MLKAEINYKSNIDGVSDKIGNMVNRAVGRSLLVLERKIKENTPTKHGHLKRSITNAMTGFGKGEVFTNPFDEATEIDYAVYVEYGTKFMAPRAMFRKGVAQADDQIKEIFKQEAQNVVK